MFCGFYCGAGLEVKMASVLTGSLRMTFSSHDEFAILLSYKPQLYSGKAGYPYDGRISEICDVFHITHV